MLQITKPKNLKMVIFLQSFWWVFLLLGYFSWGLGGSFGGIIGACFCSPLATICGALGGLGGIAIAIVQY
jgi:hypothetical protein